MTIRQVDVRTGKVTVRNEDAPSFREPATAARVKAEAERRILDIVPEWKQRNLIAQAVLLAKQVADGTPLTTQQQAEWDAGKAVWDQVKAIRDASDALEAGTIPDDYDNDRHWPERATNARNVR